MSYSFIALATGIDDASTTTVDTSTSLNVAAGDILVFICKWEGPDTTVAVAKNSGSPANTGTFDAINHAMHGNGDMGAAAGYVLNASADATATFRMTMGAARSFKEFFVYQFRPSGVSSTIKDGNGSIATGTSAAPNSGNITTTLADGFAVGFYGDYTVNTTSAELINGVSATEPSGSPISSRASTWYRILSSVFANGAASATLANVEWLCGIIAFGDSATFTPNVDIVFESSTAAVYSTSGGGTVAPNYPASIAARNLLVMVVGQKPSSANGGTVTTPTGWVLQASLTGANDGDTGGYTTTLGADTGNCNIFVYTKIADGTETGSLSVTVGTNGVCWATMHRFSCPTQSWSLAGVAGKDTSAGNVSITFASDPDVKLGDYVLGAMVIPTDVTTPGQFSSEAFSQTGVTFGTVVEIEEPDSTVGNDIGGFVCAAPVTAGLSSAAPVMTATAGGTTTNVRGPGVLLRIRQVKSDTSRSAMSQQILRNAALYNM